MTLNNPEKKVVTVKYWSKQENKFISCLGLSDDVWEASSLGLRINKHRSVSKLVFIHIKPEKFKEIAKKFIRYKAAQNQLATLVRYLTCFNKFSEFLEEFYTNLDFDTIDRQVIIDYINWLSINKLTNSTKYKCLSSLKSLFFISSINGWLNISDNLIRQEDWGKNSKPLPRYIPEEVMRQLNQNLENLPEPIQRMVLVIQECGLRVGELLQLPIDCLNQDSKGDWYIKFMRWKMKSETNLPISHELAKVIQEQRLYIQKCFEDQFDYLFCGGTYIRKYKNFLPQLKVMKANKFIKYLKDLAWDYNIKDNSGKIWDFQPHQFRHTVGTRMINNGVPQHIIQRYLGHVSPQMTMTYAYIHDETLKKEIAKYHNSGVVNIAGEVIESQTPELDNDLELHLLKKKVLAQSLPNGSCARPIQLGECPHANACLTCGDFRTTIEFLEQHKNQLEETKKIVKNAEEKGWKRQAEMNIKIQDNLIKIIKTLESEDKKIVSGGEE